MTIVESGITSSGVILNGNTMNVTSGGVANSTTICDYGDMYISSGGVANSTTVNSLGIMYISSGGEANSTTVNSGGSMWIYSGGVANSTSLNGGSDYDDYDGAYLSIYSGGIANSTTVNSGGSMWIYSGGTATDIIWTPCEGYISAADGAYVTYASQYSGVYFGSDNQLLSSAMTMDNTVVNDTMYIMSGGVANSTTVNPGGDMFISSGGVANSTTVNEWGSMFIYSDGVANNTTVNFGGDMNISSGGVANSTTVNSGYMFISSGGVANSTTINAYGDMFICSGGTATDIIWTPCEGHVSVEDGAYVTYASQYSGVYFGSDNQLLSSAMTMDNTVVNDTMYIMSGGVANSTTVNRYGDLYISSGGVANDTTVNSGYMWISSGGVANSTTVSGGSMYISSGGTATDIIWTPCEGHVSVEDGAYVTYASQYSGVYFGSDYQLLSSAMTMDNTVVYDTMYIMSGGVANNTTVDGGDMYIFSGGVANSTTVSWWGWMYISSGGVANSTTVNSGGEMYISSGGVANSTTVNSRGDMYISSGGVANSTTVSGGGMYISSGGVANSTTVSGWGWMYISSGGVANNTTVDGRGSMFISSGGVANSTTVNSGYMFISSGGVANSTTLNSRGYMNISSGGVANSTTVSWWGWMYISSGGVANDTTVDGGWMYISSGGVANSTTVNEGYMEIYSGGVANSTTVNESYMEIYSGGVANSTTLNGGSSYYNSAELYIFSGGVANSTMVNSGGKMDVEDGGVANSTVVNSRGSMYIYNGGVANSTTVNRYGDLYIDSGGVANSTTVNSSGWMAIFSGGTATDIVVAEGGGLGITVAPGTYIQGTSNGSAFEMKDASINGYTLNSGGRMYVSSGGVANSTTVDSGSMEIDSGVANSTTVNSGGWMYIGYYDGGGVANSTVVNSGGWMTIYSGGVTNDTTVNSGGSMFISSGGTALEIIENGGYVYVADGAEVTFASNTFSGLELTARSATVHSGTTAVDTILNSGGNMYISSGGIMKGNLEIADGGKVTVYEGGIIDFTVAEQKSADTALINDISRISGNSAVYTLTVSANQASGDYVLAGNAAAFDKTITVKTDEEELGELTVGDNFTVGGVVYSLHLVDSNLTLTLDGPPELDVTVSQKESLDYEFEVKISEPASLQYKIDNGDWLDADGTTIAIAQNGTYSIRAIDAAENVSNIFTKEISGLVFGNPEKVETDGGMTSWTPVKDESGNVQPLVVQYSVDNFKTVVTVVTSESALKLWSLPDNVQWRVKGKNDPEWEVGEEIAAEKNVSAPQKIESVADGVTDIFFARTAGRWTILHQARHQGIKGGWTGTQETASLGGKSKIVDVFRGAADVDILYLTDQSNGDVLFVDDIYGDSFEGIAKTQARIANLDEIRAGAGDDVVDMTSQRFNYIGDGVTIYGGDGDDVIWSNKGDNKLFGDAGNDHIVGASGNDVIVGGAGDDRMHGGGGDDIFCFGSDWGIDTVDQLSGGTVTLWFEDGSEENWNTDTRTYTDGENTVTVSGTADVTLKFGGDISSLPEGIFSNAVTKKIFESTLA